MIDPIIINGYYIGIWVYPDMLIRNIIINAFVAYFAQLASEARGRMEARNVNTTSPPIIKSIRAQMYLAEIDALVVSLEMSKVFL